MGSIKALQSLGFITSKPKRCGNPCGNLKKFMLSVLIHYAVNFMFLSLGVLLQTVHGKDGSKVWVCRNKMNGDI